MLSEAIVMTREDQPEFLVTHIIFAPNHYVANTATFLERLLRNLDLPQYILPMAAITLHKFPLSNHSKVDQRAIKALPLPKKARAMQQNAELIETILQLRGV